MYVITIKTREKLDNIYCYFLLG